MVAAAGLTQHSPGSSSSGSCASIPYLLQAVLALEAAVKGRPYCAPVRLGLTGLYGLLGNAAGAAQHFGGLDVKHVQHDTLSSHHLLPLLLGLKGGGAAPKAEALLGATCALFEDHLVDAGDTLMQAYKNGTHTKASGRWQVALSVGALAADVEGSGAGRVNRQRERRWSWEGFDGLHVAQGI